MASQVLPQVFQTIPGKQTQSHSVKKGVFSPFICRLPSAFPTSRAFVSGVHLGNGPGWRIDHFSRSDFVVRAEPSPDAELEAEGESEDSGEVDETTNESEAAGEVESEKKEPRKPLVKLGDIMGILNKRAIEASEANRPVPDLRTGDIVEIKLEVPENRRRLSIYKGIVISKQNAGVHSTIRIRRIIAGVGVEIVFPIYSPNIKEIKVVKHRKVRRARLYYLREKLPRLSTFK